jgi:TonB family protein
MLHFSKNKSYIIIILMFVILNNFLVGQTYISGELQQSTRWRGEIYVDGDVVVPEGVTLTIEEGTKIFFKPKEDSQKGGRDKQRAELQVNGILQARSNNPLNPIIFSSASKNPQMNDWYGIIIKNFYNPSTMQNCIVEFGYKGVTCYGSSPFINGGEYKFNHNSGISCEVKSNPVLNSCLIFGNGFAGINCELASSPIVSGCTISENNFGVIIFSKSSPDLGTMPLNEQKSKGGNRLSNNFEHDVYNHSNNTIYAQNNSWISKRAPVVRRGIYDRSDNSAYGEVVFEPLFVEKVTSYPVASVAIPDEERRADSLLAEKTSADSLLQDTTQFLAQLQTTEMALQQTRNPQDNFSATPPPQETMIASRETTPLVVEPTPQPVIREPVLEAFLDAGRRQYEKKVKPRYPNIYLQTGTQGDVLFEVLVDRDGNIENYRVLKSDGDLFTESSIEALEKFQYKPGKISGKPVKFKIIERFRFTLN